MRTASSSWVLSGPMVVVLAMAATGAVGQPTEAPRVTGELAGRVQGVSPGSVERFVPAASACPAFSWTGGGEGGGVELQVLRVGALAPDAAEEERALAVTLPPGASSWTAPGDRCLAAGERYAWSVRSVQGPDARAGGWSEPLLFEVPALPTAAEVDMALRVLRSYLAHGDLDAEALDPTSTDEAPSGDRRGTGSGDQVQGGGPLVAVRGEVADPGGETYGVVGVSNSPAGAGVRAGNNDVAGADLVLAGAPDARMTEGGFSRTSAANLVFDFANAGAGTMTVREGGEDLVTTTEVFPHVLTLDGSGSTLDADALDGLDSTAFLVAGADDWVNESGDAMSGPLTIDVPAGFALQTAAGDSIDVGGDLFKAGTRILHTSGGVNDLGVGPGALDANAGGNANTAVGSGALDANVDGTANTALGSHALGSNVSSDSNTAVGTSALGSNVSGTGNTAVGRTAMFGNSSANANTAVGAFALDAANTGAANVAVGFATLTTNTSGHDNVAVGTDALIANTDGFDNTALGADALEANQTGDFNVAVGRFALGAQVSGDTNTAVGHGALGSHMTGSFNVALGTSAGALITSGDNNVAIAHLGVNGDAGTIRLGTGGVHTRTFVAGVDGVTVAGGTAVFILPDGQLGTVTSSRRFKEEIAELEGIGERLLRLRPVSFRYTEEAAGEGERPIEYGLIAEEVAEVFPELVVRDAEGRPLTVRYHLLATLLLHELQRERERIGQEIDALRVELAVLRGAAARDEPSAGGRLAPGEVR